MASGQCLSMKFNEPLWMLSVQTADRKLTSTPGLFWELEAIADADGWSVDTSGCTAVMVLWLGSQGTEPRWAKRTHSALGAHWLQPSTLWDQFCSMPLAHCKQHLAERSYQRLFLSSQQAYVSHVGDSRCVIGSQQLPQLIQLMVPLIFERHWKCQIEPVWGRSNTAQKMMPAAHSFPKSSLQIAGQCAIKML